MNPNHSWYLDQLVEHLDKIGEPRDVPHWVMREGVWIIDHHNTHASLCDLIIVYPDYAIPIEQKGTMAKRDKALEQIYQGRAFIHRELRRPCPYGKFVVYNSPGNYYHERINL